MSAMKAIFTLRLQLRQTQCGAVSGISHQRSCTLAEKRQGKRGDFRLLPTEIRAHSAVDKKYTLINTWALTVSLLHRHKRLLNYLYRNNGIKSHILQYKMMGLGETSVLAIK